MDWLNLKELIGCILVEQAIGTQYAWVFRMEYFTNPIFRRKLLASQVRWLKEGEAVDEAKFAYKWAKVYGIFATVGAVIMLYAAGDFFFNIW